MGGAPILQQLHLEERLLRRTSDNWCIVNDGTAPPTIVMGVSGYIILVSSAFFLRLCVPSEVQLLMWFPCRQESL